MGAQHKSKTVFWLWVHQLIPEYILYECKVIGLEVCEDSTGILDVGHSLKVEGFADRTISPVHLSFFCGSLGGRVNQ